MEHVVVCGAGFAGLELSTLLHETLSDRVRVTLIDANDAFVFGYSKLDVMFGKATTQDVRTPYAAISKPTITFRQERITEIDPSSRRVTTDAGTYDADVLVVALGADYAPEATPGLVEAGAEFYSVAGAERMRATIDAFGGGRAVVAVCAPSFKCPPAPFETAILLHDHLVQRGRRETSTITVTSPLPAPIPISTGASKSIVDELDARDIETRFGAAVSEIDNRAKVLIYKDGAALDYDLLLAVPVHVAPAVLADTGLLVDGLVAVDRDTMRTAFEGVYGVGDCANVPTARAGVFAEGQARAAFGDIAAQLSGGPPGARYDGRGTCYIEFGGGTVAKMDADFLSGPSPTAEFRGASVDIAAEKERFGTERRARWLS